MSSNPLFSNFSSLDVVHTAVFTKFLSFFFVDTRTGKAALSRARSNDDLKLKTVGVIRSVIGTLY